MEMIAKQRNFIVVVCMVLIVGLFIYQESSFSTTKTSISQNYAGYYNLHLIPNSHELPATQSDKVIGISNDGTKEMVDSPFGYVYVRNR